MAEYLSPGVYIEEQDFRSSTIEGVSTTTTGFTGPCLFGPASGEPVLVTSFEDYRSRFGGLEPLNYAGATTTNYLAFAVRSFFDNGGRRCFISRVADGATAAFAILNTDSGSGGLKCHFRARYAGLSGEVEVHVRVLRGDDRGGAPSGVRRGDILEFSDAGTGALPVGEVLPAGGINTTNLRVVDFDAAGNLQLLNDLGVHDDPGLAHSHRLTIQVMVVSGSGSPTTYASLSAHPSSMESIGRLMRTENEALGIEPPFDRTAKVWFDAPDGLTNAQCFALLGEFVGSAAGWQVFSLSGGSDGTEPGPTAYSGPGGGLERLGEIEDIAIVAAPAAWNLSATLDRQAVRNALITHCENLKYRFAVLADSRGASSSEIMDARAKHDTTYAALYYPWVVVPDPFGAAGETIELPPDGFVTGIFARSDIETGVHKAPANEVVRGALRFNRNVTQGEQDVLNPAGVNCLRYFEGRGYLVWGARTMSSDPLWKYVNVRRLFIFLEHSIDRATQWAVFEPNNESLWLRVRLTVEAFLRNVHTTGALLGSTPQEAFFVKCDRTTMSLSDLDNGRLVCLVGVAPTRPAEFVIFRIGQWTAEASLI